MHETYLIIIHDHGMSPGPNIPVWCGPALVYPLRPTDRGGSSTSHPVFLVRGGPFLWLPDAGGKEREERASHDWCFVLFILFFIMSYLACCIIIHVRLRRNYVYVR